MSLFTACGTSRRVVVCARLTTWCFRAFVSAGRFRLKWVLLNQPFSYLKHGLRTAQASYQHPLPSPMEELAGVIAAALEGNPDAHSQLETSSTVLSVAAAAMSLLQLADTPKNVAQFAGVLVKRFARNGDADESQLFALCQVRSGVREGWEVLGCEVLCVGRVPGLCCVVLWPALRSVLLLFPL